MTNGWRVRLTLTMCYDIHDGSKMNKLIQPLQVGGVKEPLEWWKHSWTSSNYTHTDNIKHITDIN